jgi:hypothetical protein
VLTPSGGPIFSTTAKPAPKKPSRSFEEVLGFKLLPIIGIVVVVLGVGFLVGSQWGIFPHWLRVLILYAGSSGLLALGIFMERKSRYRVLGRALIGGGWAVTALITYAIANTEPLDLRISKNVDLYLLLAVIGAMVWHTLKYKSQIVTGAGFLLGFVAIGMNPSPPYNLIAGAILIAGMTVIVVRRQWFELEVFGILASYLNHYIWLSGVYDRVGSREIFPDYGASVALVIGYWAIFRVSYLVRKISDRQHESVSTFSALLNPILFLMVMKYQGFHPEWAWRFLLVMGAVEFTLGQISVSRRRRAPFLVLSSLGAALMVAAPALRSSGNALEVIWLTGAEAFLLAGILTQERLFRGFAIIISFLIALVVVPARLLPLAQKIADGQAHHDVQISLVLALAALVFYANAHLIPRRWPALFEHDLERMSLTALSWVASVFAVGAVYSYVSDSAVAVALALLVAWLSGTGKLFSIAEMTYEAHWIAAAAFIQVVAADRSVETAWLGLPQRVLAFASVAALLYLSSRFVRLSETLNKAAFSAGYAWSATALLALLIWYQYQAAKWPVAILWVVLGVALSLAGQLWKRTDLKWQAFALVLISCVEALAVNMNMGAAISDKPGTIGFNVSYRLLSIGLAGLGIYLLARWPPRDSIRPVYTAVGTLLFTFLAFQETGPGTWTAVTWVALALLLTAASLLFKQSHLKWEVFVLVVLSFVRSLTSNFESSGEFHSVSIRLIAVSLTALGIYLLARWAPRKELRPVYSALGSALLTYLAFRETGPGSWTAVAWIALALLLTAASLLFKQAHIKWEAFVLAGLSFLRTVAFNFESTGEFHSISIRLITVSLTALGIYLVARWAPIAELRPGYSVAGTFLLAYLAFKEAPAPWAAVFWVGLGLALCLAARWWKDRVLLWQTHVLALLAFGWMLFLFYDPQYRGTRVQWITVGITAVVLYALTWLSNIADIIEDSRVCQVYAWTGSLLLSWLAWYQLPAISVALAWGMFGLLLFEFPELARSARVAIDEWAAASWRTQAYVALGGSFARIFISNFNVHGWASFLCAALLVPIYFYVYWNLSGRRKSALESNFRMEFLIACLGTATLAALARFELPTDAVATGYAALTLGTLLAAWLTQRQIFLFQALVMLGVTAFRVSMTNFYHLNEPFGSSLSNAVLTLALLACAVPLAFQVRKNAQANGVPGWFGVLAQHPEQPMFFVPAGLLAALLFVKLSGVQLTGAWALQGFVVFVLALWAKERSFRLTGLSQLMAAVAKLAAYDIINSQNKLLRALTWIGVGVLMVLVGFLYSKNREALREYL